MICQKLDSANPHLDIDGVRYTITAASDKDMWNCKERIVEIYDYVDPDAMNMDLDMNTFTAWKKELVKKLKEWDKSYVKH